MGFDGAKLKISELCVLKLVSEGYVYSRKGLSAPRCSGVIHARLHREVKLSLIVTGHTDRLRWKREINSFFGKPMHNVDQGFFRVI